MDIVIREAGKDEIEALRPLLLLAEPSESALDWSLENLSDTLYSMADDAQIVGAATMRWKTEPCEIMELGIASERQGQGLGKLFVKWLIEEARRRGKREIIVGTANSSIDNIAFYQRCGFRIDHVRKDYFWYHRKPIYENGIRIRDMLVFRYNLKDGDD
jgi:GNAT superfamily N-acetyltransferase